MYQESDKFPCTRILEDNWQAILAEYQAIAGDQAMHRWPEGGLYDGKWDTFGLYAFGKKRPKNCALCPVTTRLVEQIPGMVEVRRRFEPDPSRSDEPGIQRFLLLTQSPVLALLMPSLATGLLFSDC